jgi:para-nitrobenzyl esterase
MGDQREQHQESDPGDRAGQEEPKVGTKRWRWIAAVIATVVLLIGIGTSALWEFAGPADAPPVRIADVSSERLLALGSAVGFAGAHDTHAWLGLPYARPPVDGRRWRAPQPPEAWADTRDALRFGSPCVQLSSRLGGVTSEDPEGFAGSEDCLYLNIWAPRAEPDRVVSGQDRLPVMVWIHGGGNQIGHSGSAMYDGARLAGTENVIVVSFNYRLGPFGWFSHPAIRSSSENAEEASGNFGTLDQVRALEWIQSNIEEFGGDPQNVTIFGESAGGTNVLAMLLVDDARDLFQRAIVQSGSTNSVSRAEAENALSAEVPGNRHSSAEAVVAMIEGAGVVPDLDAARGYAESLPDLDLADFLRGRTAREVVDAYRNPDRPGSLEVPRLIRDGALLPREDWNAEFRAGRFNRVPIILGSNRDEMKLFLFSDEEHVRQHFGMIFRARDLEDYERRARYHSDLWRVRGVTRPATAISEAPSNSGRAEVFAYRFDWDELPHFLGADLAILLGAAHGFEIPFVFGTFDLGNPLINRLVFNADTEASREALSARLMSYWAEFARTGRPGQGSDGTQPTWAPWTSSPAGQSGTASLLVLDTEADGGVRVVASRLSRDHVIASVDAEPGLDQDEKCELFHDLFSRSSDWSAERFQRIGRRGCADYPRE